ncbi:hypothetical protein ACWWKA_35995, partial [Klebsiella quasipneumoniae]
RLQRPVPEARMYCACEIQQTEIWVKAPWLMGGIKKRKRRPRLIAASGPKANHTYTSMPGASRTRTALKNRHDITAETA